MIRLEPPAFACTQYISLLMRYTKNHISLYDWPLLKIELHLTSFVMYQYAIVRCVFLSPDASKGAFVLPLLMMTDASPAQQMEERGDVVGNDLLIPDGKETAPISCLFPQSGSKEMSAKKYAGTEGAGERVGHDANEVVESCHIF